VPGTEQGDDAVDALLGEVDAMLAEYGDDEFGGPLEERAEAAGRVAAHKLRTSQEVSTSPFLTGLVEGIAGKELQAAQGEYRAKKKAEAQAIARLDQAEEAEAFGASRDEIITARRARKAATEAARLATAARKKAAQELREAKLKAKAARVAAKAQKAEATATVGAVPMQPIFEPSHNLREASKQMVLLEDHLFQPPRRCKDCIRKHMLTAEGLAEEAATLDKEGEWKAWTQTLPGQYRTWLGALETDPSPTNKAMVAAQIRKARKALVSDLGKRGKISGLRAGGSQAPHVHHPTIPVRARRRLRRNMGAVASTLDSVDVQDSLGNTFRVRSNGEVEAITGPLQGEVSTPSDPGYASLVADLAGNDSRVEKVLGTATTQQATGSVNPYIAGLKGEDAVVFADRSGQDSSSTTTIKGWVRGEVAKVGSEVAGYTVESIPQEGWVAVWSKDGDTWHGQWAKEGEVVKLAEGKKASDVLRGKTFNLYTSRGTVWVIRSSTSPSAPCPSVPRRGRRCCRT
jgi:hypothetical protein